MCRRHAGLLSESRPDQTDWKDPMSTLISTKGRYALRAMADLSENQGDGLIPLAEIAQRQGISEKYLESIVTTLSKAGFIVGQRGKGGGYRLARAPETYSVGDILRTVEGSIAPVACLGQGATPCPYRDDCRTLPLWEGLDKLINEYLDHATLCDLLTNVPQKNPHLCPCPEGIAFCEGCASGSSAC